MNYIKAVFYLYVVLSVLRWFMASINQLSLDPQVPLWSVIGETLGLIYLLIIIISATVRGELW